MIPKNGGYRVVLKRIPTIETHRIEPGTGNQITAVRELELKKADRDGIQVEQGFRYRTGRTLNLYTAVGCRVVEVSCPIARRLRAERCSQRGHELLPRTIALRK